MNWPDVNIIKNLSLKFQKAFDKGEIDKLYLEIYMKAEEIAEVETANFKIQMGQQCFESEYGLSDSKEEIKWQPSKILEYRNSRIQFHIDQMFKLLELYAKSKNQNVE